MFRNVITVSETPAWYNHKYLARLVARDEDASYYLSCWQLLSDERRQDREQLEDHQALNWKFEIESARAKQWLDLLRYQTIALAPAPPDDGEERDGSSFSLRWECGSHRGRHLELNWPGWAPIGWEGAGSITWEMLQIANDYAPETARRKLHAHYFARPIDASG